MGDRGRLVVPAELRERLRLEPGTPLLLLETPHGVVLATREQVKDLVRDSLRELDLVGELLAERRRQAAVDDARESVRRVRPAVLPARRGGRGHR